MPESDATTKRFDRKDKADLLNGNTKIAGMSLIDMRNGYTTLTEQMETQHLQKIKIVGFRRFNGQAPKLSRVAALLTVQNRWNSEIIPSTIRLILLAG
jgi:hypothetical protein